MSFARQRTRLFQLVTEGKVEDRFDLRRELRCVTRIEGARPLAERLPLYELCQERNRTAAHTTVALGADVDAATVLDLIDLHRTKVVLEEGLTSRRLARMDRFSEVASQIEVLPTDVFRARSYDLYVPGFSSEDCDAVAAAAVWTSKGLKPGPVAPLAEVSSDDGGAMSLGGALRLAGRLEASGKSATADDICRQLLEQLAPVHEALALLELRRNNASDAATLLGAAVAFQPDVAALRHYAAKALIAARRPTEARVHADKALELEPESVVSHDAVAASAYAQDRLQDAERALRAGLALDATGVRRWSNLATVLEGRGDLDGAIDALEHACHLSDSRWLEQRLREYRQTRGESQPKAASHPASLPAVERR